MRDAEPPGESLLRLFTRFLHFGLLAWGGPVAQIAMIKRELVDEQKWLSPSRFARLLAIYQVLPGPEAHELCVHIGTMKRGRIGGLLAGLGFMLPGFLLILGLAWLYHRMNLRQPLIAGGFLGVQIAVVALIVRAVHRISDHLLVGPWLLGLAALSAICAYFQVSFWIILPASGLAYEAIARRKYWAAALVAMVAVAAALFMMSPAGLLPGSGATAGEGAGAVSIWALLVSGLKAGLLTFGGAYTAIPFVRGDAVGKGWVSEGQFLDGLALSGIIPAPLIIFATFVGYLAGGLAGALAMTVGIFLPAFAFGIIFHNQLERIVGNPRLHDFLEGVAAGVVGLVAATTLELGLHVAQSVPLLGTGLALFGTCLAALYWLRSKWSVPVVILFAGVAGSVLFA